MAPCTLVLVVCYRVVLVMNRRCRTGQVVDFVDLDIERESHIVAHQLEVRVIEQVNDVVFAAGEEVIDADDVVAFFKQTAGRDVSRGSRRRR